MLKYHMSLVELCRIARMHPLYCQWKVRHSHQRVQNPLYQAVHIFFSLPEAVDDMRCTRISLGAFLVDLFPSLSPPDFPSRSVLFFASLRLFMIRQPIQVNKT